VDASGTIQGAILQAVQRFATTGVDSPRLSAELLAGKAFGLSRLELVLRHDEIPTPERLDEFLDLVRRREAGEPAAYILGEREFYGLPFRVTPDVLIPRPETEGIVDEALRVFAKDSALHFADFGTGSGALAVTLAHEFPAARGLAVDISPAALGIARANAETSGVVQRIDFLEADFTALDLAPASLDLVVANPPYVTGEEYADLPHEVRAFEPMLALVSPDEGLAHIRGLLPTAARALRPGGLFLCELGCGQGPAALALADADGSGFGGAVVLKDYAGLDRILRALRNG